jgi:hypothetical protein
MSVFSHQKETMTRDELAAMASGALASRTLAATDDFSPAEAFAGLVESILSYEGSRALPKTVGTRHPLGPLEMPLANPEIGRVSLKDVSVLAHKADEIIRRTGALPAALSLGTARLGTGSLFALFAEVYLDLASDKPRTGYDVPAFEPYPRTNEQGIIGQVEGYKTWPVHRPDLDMSRVVEFTKLQLWTLKPAIRK